MATPFLINAHSHIFRILNYINEAEQIDGAQVLLDGRTGWGPTEGSWVGPTILLHSSAQDKAMREEIFGPVLSVIRVSTCVDRYFLYTCLLVAEVA